MKTRLFHQTYPALVLLLVNVTSMALAGSLQLVSVRDPALSAPAGGDGDSMSPIMSPDGRYVLFASAADNLVLLNGSNAMQALFPAPLNVYLRDRSNATTTLISVNLAGTGGGNSDSLPSAISPDGRYALFESSASDLVSGDTNEAADVFLCDLFSGQTLLVSAGRNGQIGNGASGSAVMTPDGRYVAFVSDSSNFVPEDTNGIPDVFVKDLKSGGISLVSVGAVARARGPLPGSESPLITPDGRYVAFYSTATNLVSDADTNLTAWDHSEIYVRDLVEGATTWASAGGLPKLAALFGVTNTYACNHAISDDGRYVAYEAIATFGLRSGAILRYDLQTGASELVCTNATWPRGYPENYRGLTMTPDGRFIAFVADIGSPSGSNTCVSVWEADSGTIKVASAGLANTVPPGSLSDSPAIEPSGRFVAFVSDAPGLVTNSLTGDFHLYVRDLLAEAPTLVDVDMDGIGSGVDPVIDPQLSADGRFVAFDVQDGALIPDDRNNSYDVFVRNLQKGTTEIVSSIDPRLAGVTPNAPSSISAQCASTDGRYVVFSSAAGDIVPHDTNSLADLFVRDLVAGTTALVNVGTDGVPADGPSGEPAISGDGRYVVFSSFADNLVPGDTNHAQDVFVRDLVAGTTALVSVSTNGVSPGNLDSYSPVLSTDGKYVLFRSRASDLANVRGTSYTSENLFLRNLDSGVTRMVSVNSHGSGPAAMTPDGRYVAFSDTSSYYLCRTYIWDSQAATTIYTNGETGFVQAIAISADGTRLAWLDGPPTYFIYSLYAADRVSGRNWTVLSGSSPAEPRFSQDGSLLLYRCRVTGTNQIYLYDLETGTNALVSHADDGSGLGNGNSDSADMTSDGRFIAYRSAASNLVPGDNNNVPDVFLYDRQTDTTTLLSASRFGDWSADNRSLRPFFSGDGLMVFFESWASDLIVQDFNHSSDIFALKLFASWPVPQIRAEILPDVGPAQGSWLSWPVVPGWHYRVQFKNSLDEQTWQDLNAAVSITGSRAWVKNPISMNGRQCFYRVVAF